jgi:acetyl-CoA carboxylase carboxyltransferase component
MSIVARASAQDRGIEYDEERDRALREGIETQIESESRALENSGRLYDDGIIDPRDTRAVLGIALSACHSQQVAGTDRFGVFRM